MSAYVQATNVSQAWLETLEAARGARGGRQVHIATAISDPLAEVAEVRAVIDSFLSDRNEQSTETVAETIFPSSLYQDPGFTWEPGIDKGKEAALDAAAADLYDGYIDMLPMLMTINANNRGTYFSRMIHWPGNQAEGINQLALRIARIRSLANNNTRTNNTLDIDVAADALEEDGNLPGVQLYAVTDMRTRGFPCLTHVDLTLLNGVLHCTAVYRHQYLVKKAYGNLVGLAALMQFLSQQTGCEVGELMVHATMADSEKHSGTTELIAAARTALDAGTASR